MEKRLNYGCPVFLSAVLIITAATCLTAVSFSETYSNQSNLSNMEPAAIELSSIKKANAWLNSPPLTAPGLKGKVVLIQFGTYTCINWIRTLPYIRAWNEKYKDRGLVVIGVHTPEFSFEKNIDNVRLAIQSMKIGFPIAVDNKRDIWNGFNNQYWPALYFIDARGRVRHHHFGEGGYEQSEKVIQQLLTEAGAKDMENDLVPVNPTGIEAGADWNSLHSPENYLGYERTENFAGARLVQDKPFVYTTPLSFQLNQWSPVGNWTIEKEFIKLNQANGRIICRFQARDVHLVMGPAVAGTSIRFRILIDGKAPATAHGIDVDEQGNGTITEQRMYQLVRQPPPISEHEIVIEFFDTGVEAYAFTFG